MYTVYVIVCKTPRHLYVGQTKNFERRMREHQSGRHGARFVKQHGFVRFCPLFRVNSSAKARKLEAKLVRRLRQHSFVVPDGEPWWVTEYRAERRHQYLTLNKHKHV